jgi:hypothetical protein
MGELMKAAWIRIDPLIISDKAKTNMTLAVSLQRNPEPIDLISGMLQVYRYT